MWILGFRTQRVMHYRQLKVRPDALYAAFDHSNSFGVYVPEQGGGALGKVGRKVLGAGKHGIRNPKNNSMASHVDAVVLADGSRVTGKKALKLVKAIRRDRERIGEIDHVELRNVDLVHKEGNDTSIGPWEPDDHPHRNQREVRALATTAMTWLATNDTRFNNLRLDVRTKKGKLPQLKFKFSDAGNVFNLYNVNKLHWDVDLKVKKGLLHTDHAMMVHDAFDGMTVADARSAVRGIAALSREQIKAIVVAGGNSYPVVRLLTEKLVARRDSLVAQFGLEGEFEPLGADRNLTVRGGGTIRVGGETVRLPAGGYRVEKGRLIESK